MLWLISIIITVIIGLLAGFALAKRFLRNAHQSLNSISLLENLEAISKNAEAQREMILQEASIAAQEQYAIEAAKFDLERESLIQLQEKSEKDLNLKQSETDKFASALEKKIVEIEDKNTSIQNIKNLIQETEEKKLISLSHYQEQLEDRARQKKNEVFDNMYEEIIHAEKLGITRYLIDNMEALKTDAQKFARVSLTSVYHKYQPQFIWPKSSFLVALPKPELVEKYFFEESPLVQTLIAGTDSSLNVLTVEDEQGSMLKIANGAGVDKEIIRLTLEDMLHHQIFDEGKIKGILAKHRKQIEDYVLRLGEEAIKNLGLEPVHKEIAKLIGSLNYRTSHRQNQYYHSMEVSRLAGMIAKEVGVDANLAKRAGILHDIGKVLDYKIEGSHAVISGDYATRFGETEDVVDTVLAHHDDKVVETPHAYILKAADAMSGARPGARVDMEEGFHRRIDGISNVVNSFEKQGVLNSAIMHAGREVHVFVDNNRVREKDIAGLAEQIAKKLEHEVEYPGQIRVTVIRRTEITAVA